MGSEMCIRDRVHRDQEIARLDEISHRRRLGFGERASSAIRVGTCLLYTSDAADERSSVDLGGRRIIKKKNSQNTDHMTITHKTSKINDKTMQMNTQE